jgi:uncharacterized RDD family membrane protein YckC
MTSIMHSTDVDVESRHRVRSADEVMLEIPVAGPTSRILAYAVDAAIVFVIEGLVLVGGLLLGTITVGVIGEALRRVADVAGGDAGAGWSLAVFLILLILLQLLIEIVYFVTWEVLAGGRTPGKMLLGLRVVRDGGLPLTPWASLVRNVLRAVDQLPYGYTTGLIAIVLSPDAKRLGDLAAGTLVMRLERPKPLEALPSIERRRIDAVRLTAAQVALLDADAVHLARSTLRRLGTLEADQRAQILATAVHALGRRLDTASPDDPEAFLHAVVDAFAVHRR